MRGGLDSICIKAYQELGKYQNKVSRFFAVEGPMPWISSKHLLCLRGTVSKLSGLP